MVHEEGLDTTRAYCGDLTANDRRNSRRSTAWMLVWMLAWGAALIFVAKRSDELPAGMGWALAAATLVPGILGLRAYVRFLREADELVRKIQLEALAFAFGVGTLFMMTWRIVEKSGGGPQLDVSDPVMLMFVVWAAAQWWFARRYR